MKKFLTIVFVCAVAISATEGQPPQKSTPPKKIVAPIRGPVVKAKPTPGPAVVKGVTHLSTLPKGHVTVTIGGKKFFNHGHVFYQSSFVDGKVVYVHAAPPIGATVTYVPAATRVVVNGQTYLEIDSAFFRVDPVRKGHPPQYTVVRPPVGLVVGQLPPNSKAHQRDGQSVFVVGSTEYRQIQVSGKTQYIIIR